MAHWGAVKGIATAAGALALVLASPARAEDQGTSAGDRMQQGSQQAGQGAQQMGQGAEQGARDTAHSADQAADNAGRATSNTVDQAQTGAGTAMNSQRSASSKDQKETKKVLSKLHNANAMEIEAGRLAEQNGSSDQVKEFGRRMVDDHGTLDKQVMDLAQAQGIDLASAKPDKDAQKDMKKVDELRNKTGSSFDKAYMDMMVKDHEKDVKEVKSAQKDAQKKNQTELTSLLQQAAPKLQEHLTMAKDVKKSLSSSQRMGRRGSSAGAMGSGSTGSDTGSASTPTNRDNTVGSDTQGGGTGGDHPDQPPSQNNEPQTQQQQQKP